MNAIDCAMLPVPRIPTLKHLSLHVTEGEMLLLAGCSGCGKSTLIKAVSGLLNTAGAGELDGKIYLNNKEKDSGVHFRCPLNVAVN